MQKKLRRWSPQTNGRNFSKFDCVPGDPLRLNLHDFQQSFDFMRIYIADLNRLIFEKLSILHIILGQFVVLRAILWVLKCNSLKEVRCFMREMKIIELTRRNFKKSKFGSEVNFQRWSFFSLISQKQLDGNFFSNSLDGSWKKVNSFFLWTSLW